MILNTNFYLTIFAKLLELRDNEKIININYVPLNSFTSNTYMIKIEYCANNKIQEKTFFLKTSSVHTLNTYHSLCVNEIDFYKTIRNHPLIDVLPTCFYEEYNQAEGETVLVLEDLSKEYISIPISNIKIEHILSSCLTLSKFHSKFWNDKSLNEKNFDYIQIIDESNKMIKAFFKYNSHHLSNEFIEMINEAHTIYNELLTEEYYRKKKGENITVINGDAHISNFMFSKSTRNQPKLIDFQFWKVGIGCLDLAHLTRKTTTISKSKQDHECIVKKYHKSLVEYGVGNYTYEECFFDYQRCVASLMLNPIWQNIKFNIPFDVCIQPMNSLIRNYKTLKE